MDPAINTSNSLRGRMPGTSKRNSNLIVTSMDRPSSPRRGSENCMTTSSSNSIFRNLFSRKRNSATEDQISSVVETVSCPASSATSQHSLLDGDLSLPEQCSRMNTIVSRRSQARSKSRPRKRVLPGTHESIHSLPLSEVYAQASLHSTLQIPTKGVRDWLSLGISRSTSRRQSEISSKAGANDTSNISSSKTDAERSVQDARLSESYQLVDKLFFLCKHGSILQYNIDGQMNRLPEKSFQILPDSVAFASDAVSGKYWVLEISVSGVTVEASRNAASWSTWSKLSFRTTGVKGTTESLLVVFDSPELMSTWLSAVRREIDSLGGSSHKAELPYNNPDARAPSLRNTLSDRSSLRTSFLRFSRSTSNLRSELYDPSTLERDLPRLPISSSTYQKSVSGRSVTASSIATTTSLDRLKDADTGSTTTATTNSLDGSIALESPIKAAFADIMSPVPSIETRSSMTAEQKLKDFAPVHTFSERQKYNVNHLHQRSASSSSGDQARPTLQTNDSEKSLYNKPRHDKHVYNSAKTVSARPTSVLMPLPSADNPKTSLIDQQPSTDQTGATPNPEKQPLANSYNNHTSKVSIDGQAKSMYSLFPRKLVQEVKMEPLIVPEANHIPGLTLKYATHHLDLPPLPEIAGSTSPVALSSRHVPVKRPSALKLLTPLEVEQPERSPAVSADMLASNFGTTPLGHCHSPIFPSKILVPSFEDLRIYMGVGENNVSNEEPSLAGKSASVGDFPGIKRQQGSPTLHPLSRAPLAPVGPPPKGPLPAVPTPDGSAASSRTNSQVKRDSIQDNHQKSNRSSASIIGAPRSRSSYKRPRSKSQAGKITHPERLSKPPIAQIATSSPSSPPQPSDAYFGRPSVV